MGGRKAGLSLARTRQGGASYYTRGVMTMRGCHPDADMDACRMCLQV